MKHFGHTENISHAGGGENMKKRIITAAAAALLCLSCMFAEGTAAYETPAGQTVYTAQVILNIQDETKVAWTSDKYEPGSNFASISDGLVSLHENPQSGQYTSAGSGIFASGESNLDTAAARIKIYGTPLYEEGNNTDPERIDYKLVLGELENVENKVTDVNLSTASNAASMGYGTLLAEFSSTSENDNSSGSWQPWVFSIPITIETVGDSQETVNKLSGGTSLTGTLTLCVESS